MERFGERLRRAERGFYYTISQVDDFLADFGKPKIVKHRRIEYLNLICAFDTETTSFDYNGVALGTMYEWTFGINGAVMIGRTWEQLMMFCDKLILHFKLSPKRRLLIYVHNLSFDFQFFRKHFKWLEVFAREKRTPMYATTINGLEFRCSYILTNSSLSTVGKNIIRYPIEKLTGELDYNLMRHSYTPLTVEELQYCINDVLVVMSLVYDRMQSEKNIAKIPLTQTGYARRECRGECLYKDKKHITYLNLMRELTMEVEEYKTAKLAFAGGFTHASPNHVGQIGFNLDGYDFTSSYPAVIVAEKYPMGKGIELDVSQIKSREELNVICINYCCLMILEFENLNATVEQDYYISDSRCTTEKADCFNGRVVSAEKLLIAVTDVDWEIIQQAYTWTRFRIIRIWRYRKAYLPTPYIRTVLHLYKKKTELKGVAGAEEEYMRAKELLNSLYGMMATQIDRDEVVYTDSQEWDVEQSELTDTLGQYNKDTRRFISYLWGCYVTAYARRNLWSAIITIGGDYWYSDTDSVKISNGDRYKSYFDNYNKWIINKLKMACDYHKIPYEYVMPKTVYGVEKPLGVWDYECRMSRFKTVGAKRYLYTTKDKTGKECVHITCAGVGKQPAIDFLVFKYKNLDAIFNAFADGLHFPSEYNDNGKIKSATGKSTHTYVDVEFDAELTDYLGQTADIHELSCVNLSGADYNLGISGAFFDFLANYFQGKIVTDTNV